MGRYSNLAVEALWRWFDPVVAGVLTRIADDERRHAALAWRFLAWTLEPVRFLISRSTTLRSPRSSWTQASAATSSPFAITTSPVNTVVSGHAATGTQSPAVSGGRDGQIGSSVPVSGVGIVVVGVVGVVTHPVGSVEPAGPSGGLGPHALRANAVRSTRARVNFIGSRCHPLDGDESDTSPDQVT